MNKSGDETLLTLAFCIRMNIAADNCQAGSVYSENLLLMKDLCIGMYYCVSTKSRLGSDLGKSAYDSYILMYCSVAQSCPALRDPMNYSPPGSSVGGIPQARILEWVDIASSRGSSRPRD